MKPELALLAAIVSIGIAGAAPAAPVIVAATATMEDTCFNGNRLGVESIPGLDLGRPGKLYLAKCDCDCTIEESDLQIVSLGDKGEVTPIANFIGYRLKVYPGAGKTGKLFSLLEWDIHEKTTDETPITYDGKTFKG